MIHILNGDGTRGGFERSGIAGDMIIWREMLCEGPVQLFWSEESFRLRKSFLQKNYPTGNKDFYDKKVKSGIKKIIELDIIDELVLWFEYDLFCQVNLWNCLSILSEKKGKISLICPTSHPSVTHFKGIGQLDPEYYPELLANRVTLGPADLACGKLLWGHYVKGSLEDIQPDMITSSLDVSLPAIKAHLKRFAHPETGMSELQTFLLKPLFLSGPMTKRELLINFLRTDSEWGLGDLQVNRLIEDSKEFVNKDGKLALNQKGIEAMKQMNKM